jgi:hypothetical protein
MSNIECPMSKYRSLRHSLLDIQRSIFFESFPQSGFSYNGVWVKSLSSATWLLILYVDIL